MKVPSPSISEPSGAPTSTGTAPILEANPLRREASGVWRRNGAPAVAGFGYSDGDAEERYLESVLTEADDRSTYSPALRRAIVDWPSEYHLSCQRSNLLHALDLTGIRHALELGCGCGAITRFLGEQGVEVDAIEGAERRARIAALRCGDLANVRVVCANYNELEIPERSYDVVLLVGVLEYALRFQSDAASGREAVKAVLSRARAALTGDGVIVIAIENRLGLKYLLGAGEDHYGVPYVGVYDYPDADDIRTYSRPEWEGVLGECGFADYEFCYPFPDYKLPTVILRDGFVASSRYPHQHLSDMVSRDYGGGVASDVDEGMLWWGLGEAGRIGEFANAFLIVAGGDAAAVQRRLTVDFVHVTGLHRHLGLRTVTEKLRGIDVVRKRALAPSAPPVAAGPLIQRLGQEPFVDGYSLSERWLRIFYTDPRLERFIEEVGLYYDLLKRLACDAQMAPLLFDAMPKNLIVANDGTFEVIDREWQSAQPLEPGYVLFRGLFYFLVEHLRALRRLEDAHHLTRVVDIIERCFRALDLDLYANLDEYVAFEDAVQEAVHAADVHSDTRQYLEQPIALQKFHPQLYWSVAGEDCAPERMVSATAAIGAERQAIDFALPPAVDRIAILRLDPVDRPGYFHLYRLTVSYMTANGERRQLVDWRSGSEIAANARPQGIDYGTGLEHDVFVATVETPLMEFFLDEKDQSAVAGDFRVSLEMDWPQSRDFVVARDLYMRREHELRARADQYEQARRRLERAERQLERREAELELIKRSKVWRLATRFREGFYQRWLGAVPVAQRTMLIATRDGWRAGWRALATRLRTGEFPAIERKGFVETPDAYQEYRRIHALTDVDREAIAEAIRRLSRKPKISIVMPVYNVDPAWLDAAVQSVRGQLYGNWELCLVDDCSTREETRAYLRRLNDPRIRLRFLDTNKNISGATNDAVAMASGEYIAFMDDDDELAEDALYEMARAIDQYDPDLLYSDEDLITPKGQHINPNFKPDFSPDLLLSHNYITHLFVLRRSLLREIGPLRAAFDGAQDYDLVLRASERAARIHHVPKVLYHWRMSAQSTSMVAEVKPQALAAARGALEEALVRRGIDAEVLNANIPYFFRVKRALHAHPKVSIVIPFKDAPQLLEQCVSAIFDKSTYPNFEILGVSNNSLSSDTFRLMRELERNDARFRAIELNVPFNFSGLVNAGVAAVDGEHVVLMNNDIEIISWDWIEALLEHSAREEVGAVGGKLYYPDDTIQHAGIAVGIGGYAGHMHKHFPARRPGYVNRANIIQNVSAVTGAFMMVARTIYQEIGGFDETHLKVACNDVDFCLRAIKAGYLNVFTPYAEAYHLESVSRGYEDTAEKQARFAAEKRVFSARHRDVLERGDPYYNPNLSLDTENFTVRV